MRIVIPIRAKPFARRDPRKGGGFYDRREALKAAIGHYARIQAVRAAHPVPTTDRLIVKVIFRPSCIEVDWWEVERLRPKCMVGDIDNFQKLVFDALNGIIWKDDRQIEGVIAEFAGFGEEE